MGYNEVTEEVTADYYSCTDVDQLSYDDVDSAVEGHLDLLEPEDWPEELVVMGYVESTEFPEPIDGVQQYEHDAEYDVTIDVHAWVLEHAQHWLEFPDVDKWMKEHATCEEST